MTVRLGDVCAISASAKENPDEYVWLLNLDMVEQQTGRILQYVYVPKEEAVGSIIRFDTDNVLYSKLRPNLNKVVLPTKDGFATSELLPLRPDTTTISKEYLATYLRSGIFVAWATSKATGAKMPRLASKELLNKTIPLPSLAEQKRIASVIGTIDNLIALHKRQLAKLDELVKARFVEMFGNPVQPESKWRVSTFGDEFHITSGGTPDTKNSAYWEHGTISWIGSNMCQDEIVFQNDGKYITTEGLAHSSAKVFESGTVLVALVGATIGKTALLRFSTATNQNVAAIDVNKNKNFTAEYVYYQLQFLYPKFQELGNGTFKMANQAFIRELPILCPPHELQVEFSDFIEDSLKLRLTIRQGLDKMETLKRALMQEYFG